MGPGIAGLNLPSLSPQYCGTAGFLIPCPNRLGKFHMIYLSGFEQGFDHKNVTAVLVIYPGMQRGKSISPLLPGSIGAVVTNDWCMSQM